MFALRKGHCTLKQNPEKPEPFTVKSQKSNLKTLKAEDVTSSNQQTPNINTTRLIKRAIKPKQPRSLNPQRALIRKASPPETLQSPSHSPCEEMPERLQRYLGSQPADVTVVGGALKDSFQWGLGSIELRD